MECSRFFSEPNDLRHLSTQAPRNYCPNVQFQPFDLTQPCSAAECDKTKSPVCDSNNRTHKNMCLFKFFACKVRIKLTAMRGNKVSWQSCYLRFIALMVLSWNSPILENAQLTRKRYVTSYKINFRPRGNIVVAELRLSHNSDLITHLHLTGYN